MVFFVTNAVFRSPCKTNHLIEFFYCSFPRSEAKSVLHLLSMLYLFSLLHSFPMAEIHPCVDIFVIFRIELIHMLLLGMNRLLKEFSLNVLKNNRKTTVALQSKQGVPKTYKQVRKLVLHTLNLFLKQVKCDSSGFQLSVYFLKGELSHNVSRLFRDDGLIGMFEASNSKKIDQVLLFRGAIADLFCANDAGAYTTKVFVTYADLLLELSRKLVSQG